jgi:hypothetical protein
MNDESMNERIMGTPLIRSFCPKKCSRITYYVNGLPGFQFPRRIFSYEVSDHRPKEKLIYVVQSSTDPYLSCSKTSFHQIVERGEEQKLIRWENIMNIDSFLPFSSQEELNNLIPRLLKLKAFS